MADEKSPAQKAYGDIAPALADYSDKVLFGDVWERPGAPAHRRRPRRFRQCFLASV
jgi:4-carboxymuconolactone decarboxylase